MDDNEALELIDAHLDRQSLNDEQSDSLTAWIKENPQHADDAFYRIFLHSYLRLRFQVGLLPVASELSVLEEPRFDLMTAPQESSLITADQRRPRKSQWFWRLLSLFACLLLTGALSIVGWRQFQASRVSAAGALYAYEGFDYPATPLPIANEKGEARWATSGGLQGLSGGTGWSEGWQETNSKVAVIVDYGHKEMKSDTYDMRKFGPLGYTDSLGNVLQSSGHQMRTATSPRSISTRQFELSPFPESMRDEQGLGRDGCVVWLSFLAQSSRSTAENNRYSYLLIGSKTVAGLRIGKLGAASSGNWTAVGLQTGAEVNLRSSNIPSGEIAFFVARVIFRPGPEEAVVWINPKLDAEPQVSDSSMRLLVPDFRFHGISINANHSTDFDEIRFGGSFRSIAPIR